MSTMKTLVSGFVDRPPAGQDGQTAIIILDIHELRRYAASKTETDNISVQSRY